MARTPKRKPLKSGGGDSYGDAADEKSAAEPKTGGADKGSKDTADVHALAIKRWQAGYERDRDNIDMAYEDLEFLEGNQWPLEAVRTREHDKLPVQTFNRMPQFVRQITGDMRLSKPGIKVVPVDSGSDREVARVRAGLIRYIENRSDAQAAYYHGGDQQVAAGIGHWRVIKEYAGDTTFNQELRIVAIDDGLSVIWDPDAILPNKEDAKYCFVPVDMSHESYKEKFPDVALSDFEDSAKATTAGWYGIDFVRVAEYWVKKPSKRMLVLLPDGKIDDITDDATGKAEKYKAQGARIEQRDSYKVCRYLISFSAILEGPVDWPGRYIPIIRCPGEETRIGRKTKRRGIIRFAQDPQRAYNYGRSTQTHITGLQPKSPFIGTEKNFKGNEAFWNLANVKSFPWLPYTPDTVNGGAPPQRSSPAVSMAGVNETVALAAEDMKAVIGIYDAGLGQRSNETSGVAINARARESDVGSFVYQDNWSRAIRHTATIVNDLIPHVYDVERTIRILGEDGKEELIEINKAVAGDGMEDTETVMNDVTLGAYDVVFQPGPSYSTRREESREGMKEFIQAAPQVAPLIFDMYAESQDWPNSEKVSKRLDHLLPPEIRQREAAERGEQLPPTPPNPQAQAAQAAQQADMQFQMHKMQGELQKQQLENEGKQIDNERRKIELAASVNTAHTAGQGAPQSAVSPYAASIEQSRAVEASAKAETARSVAQKAAFETELKRIELMRAMSPAPPKPPSESINFKDVPPEAGAQMLAQAGIAVHPATLAAHNEAQAAEPPASNPSQSSNRPAPEAGFS